MICMSNFPCISLLLLFLNSCNGHNAFWCSFMLVKQSSSFSRKHWTSSLQICVCQTVRLTTEFVDWCRNVCTLYKHLSMIPAAVTSNLKQPLIDTSGKQITKRQWLCARIRQKDVTSLWTSAKLKPALLRANTLHNRFSSEPPTVYLGKRCFASFSSHPFIANKVSKSEGTRKVKYAYHFWKCADAVDRKLSKLVHACRSYSLPKLAHFLRHSVYPTMKTKKYKAKPSKIKARYSRPTCKNCSYDCATL